MKFLKVLFALAAVFILFIGCSSPASPASPAPKQQPQADPVATLFDSYHITKNDSPQVAGYNPFGRSVVQLQSRREIFFTGQYAGTASPSRLVNLWEDYNNGGTITNTSILDYGAASDPVFAKKPHASAAGDIDGDGKEEVVTVYYTGTTNNGKNTGKALLCLMGKDKTLVTAQQLPGNPDFSYCVRAQDQYLTGHMQAATGDIDGDGRLEIGLVVGETFLILDDKVAGYAQLYQHDFRGSGQYDGTWATVNWYVRIAAGDVNGDGKDEFAAISGYWTDEKGGYATAKYSVVGGTAPHEIANGIVADMSGSAEILFGNVAVGDLDGDGVKELCFSGISKRTTNTLIDNKVITGWWTGTAFQFPGGDKTLSYSFNGGRDQYRPLPTSCFKPKLGMKESLFALNRVIDYDAVSGKLSITTNLPENPSVAPDYLANSPQHIATGDVDRDGLDEIVALYIGAPKTLNVYKVTGSGTLAPPVTISNDQSTAYNVGSLGVYESLCLPDWDGDSITLKFQDSHVEYTQPKVLAVIASPPFWADQLSSDSYSNYSTSYGTSQGQSYERTDTFKVGTTISYSEGLDGDLGFSAEYGVSVGASFGHTKSFSAESVMAQTETTIAGEDKVLYMSIPFDVYRFTIVSSPIAGKVGTDFSVNIPRVPQIRSMELKAFNALPHNPAVIDATFLDHTIGNPESYPTKAAMLTKLTTSGGFWDATGKNCGRSNSSTGSAADKTTSAGNGFSVGASTGVSGKVGALWHTLGVEGTFDYEWNSTVSTMAGTSISGTIPDLPVGAPLTKDFCYGVSLYTKTLSSQADPVMVVSYWVTP